MRQRRYGQYCGVAQAAELVGERWTLLIIRDLLTGPKRFTDLRRGLSRIPTNILSARLKRLETDGVVRRRVLPRPASSVVYELTGYGHDLEDVVLALGRWGARTLGEPQPDDVVTTDSMIMAMRAAFRPEHADGVEATFELHVSDVVLDIRVWQNTLHVEEGPATEPDLVVEADPAIRALLTGELSLTEALARGHVHVTGDRALLPTFGTLFRL